LSVADRERYARDRARIRQRQAVSRSIHGSKWSAERRRKYAANAILQTKAIWRGMIARCFDPRHDAYSYYGAEGIRVCERWMESFDNFLADMGERPRGMSIERENGAVGYEPSNCKWATKQEQMVNRRLPKSSIPSCFCGSCLMCRNRESVRRYREKQRRLAA
jgi:hypothetical protein